MDDLETSSGAAAAATITAAAETELTTAVESSTSEYTTVEMTSTALHSDFAGFSTLAVVPLNSSSDVHMSAIDHFNLTKSLALLGVAVAPNSTLIFYGFLALITNTITILAIWRSKSLHTKCFLSLAVNSLIDLLLGASYGATGIVRVYRYYAGLGDVHTMWTCLGEVGFNVYAQLLALGMAPALVIERLLATFFPHIYRGLTYRRFTIPLIVLVNIYGGLQFAVHFQNSYVGRHETLFTCGAPDTLNTNGTQALAVIQIGTSVIVLALNAVLAYGVRVQNRKIRAMATKTTVQQQLSNSTNGAAQKSEERDRKIFKSIFLISLFHVLCHFVGRLAIFATSSFVTEDTGRASINRWGRTLIVLNAATHFFVLYGTSAPFRKATRGLWKRGQVESSVGGASIAGGVPAATPRVSLRQQRLMSLPVNTKQTEINNSDPKVEA